MLNYEQWLDLSDDERERLFKEWIANRGDGEPIVREAGRRLMAEVPEILETSPGIYHGGEWIIHAYVTEADWQYLPKFPYDAQEYAGFRVFYMYGPRPSER